MPDLINEKQLLCAMANDEPGALEAQVLSTSGYYLVQTGPTSYDMVSALDAKAWIRWAM